MGKDLIDPPAGHEIAAEEYGHRGFVHGSSYDRRCSVTGALELHGAAGKEEITMARSS
jgi:hypothetical protein